MINSPLLPHVLLLGLLFCLASLTLTRLLPVLLPLCAVAAPAPRGWPRKLAPPVLIPVYAMAAAQWGRPRDPGDRTPLTLSVTRGGTELSLFGSLFLLLLCR